MGRSAADTPTTPEFIRISDEERDHAIDELKHDFVDGRLSHDTFLMRMHAALSARNSGQLAGLFGDLPPRPARFARAWEMVRRAGLRAGLVPKPLVADEPEDYALAENWQPGQMASSAPAAPPVIARPTRPPAPLMFPRGAGTTFTIGRHRDCDLYISDMSVSRVHAQLARESDGWQLSDLGSTNGTRLNGWLVRAAVPIEPGDLVRFGVAEFIVQVPGAFPLV